MPQVKVKNGPNKGQVFKVRRESITIGRDPTCTIQIMDKGASRKHAEIFRVGEMCFIKDLGSRNGTFVNDGKITDELLREGDRIQIGGTTLTVEESAKVEGDTAMVEFAADDAPAGATIELRLDDVEDDLGEEEDRDSANFRAIYKIGRIISSERDPGAMMGKVLSEMGELLPLEAAYIFLKEEKTGKLVPAARHEKHPGTRPKVSRTIIKRVLQESRSVLTSDAASDARFKAGESIVLGNIRSAICAPLVAMDKIRGVLYMTASGRSGRPFAQEDLELATAAGTQLGMGLESLRATAKQREIFINALRTLVAAAEMREPSMRGHSERVMNYGAAIAGQMNLPEKLRLEVQIAGLLHDIGKVIAPREAQDASADEEERRASQAGHVLAGEEIARSMKGLEGILPGIRGHHERPDGTGFPDNLKGDKIPVVARVVGAANTFDHLTTSGGEDGQGMPIKDAMLKMSELAGEACDEKAVEALFIAYRSGTLYSSPSTKKRGEKK